VTEKLKNQLYNFKCFCIHSQFTSSFAIYELLHKYTAFRNERDLGHCFYNPFTFLQHYTKNQFQSLCLELSASGTKGMTGYVLRSTKSVQNVLCFPLSETHVFRKMVLMQHICSLPLLMLRLHSFHTVGCPFKQLPWDSIWLLHISFVPQSDVLDYTTFVHMSYMICYGQTNLRKCMRTLHCMWFGTRKFCMLHKC